MAGHFNHIFGRIGMRGREPRNDYLVEARRRIFWRVVCIRGCGRIRNVQQIGNSSLPGKQLGTEAHNPDCDALRLRAGKAHDADAAASRRGSNGNDSVIRNQ